MEEDPAVNFASAVFQTLPPPHNHLWTHPPISCHLPTGVDEEALLQTLNLELGFLSSSSPILCYDE